MKHPCKEHGSHVCLDVKLKYAFSNLGRVLADALQLDRALKTVSRLLGESK